VPELLAPDLNAIEDRARRLAAEVTAAVDLLARAVAERWLAEPGRAGGSQTLAHLERALAGLETSLDRFLDVLLAEKLAGSIRQLRRARLTATERPGERPDML
jgi:hypothetical protein